LLQKNKKKETMGAPGFVGLREMLRTVVQRDVLKACKAQSKGWLVLVLDAEASRVLTPILGMYDLMEEGVTLVESLEKRRQPFPEMDVVYVAAARQDSIRLIIGDWNQRQSLDSQYGAAHLFFLSAITDDQVADLGAVPELTKRLKTLTELNLDFLAVESQAFSLGVPEAFASTAVSTTRQGTHEETAARKFATVIATLGETAPVFRYRSERARTFAEVTRRFAKAMTKGGKKKKKTPERPPATVLILDRADDALSPLMHEYTYQALVQDMLDVDGECRDKVKTKTETKSGQVKEDTTLLNEKDKLWVEFRHVHVATVVDELRKRVADFLTHNAGATQLAKGKGGDLSLQDMSAALKQMPEFQAATAAMNKHMTIASDCLAKFQNLRVLETSQLEQTLATLVDADGEKVTNVRDLLGEVCELVQMQSADPTKEHLLRLVAAYFVARGGRLAARERDQILGALDASPSQLPALLTLAKHVALNQQGAAQDALRLAPIVASVTGKKATRGPPRGKKKSSFAVFKKAIQAGINSLSESFEDVDDNEADQGYANSRYVPPFKAALEAAAYERLPPDLYPPLSGDVLSSSDLPPAKVAAQSVRTRNKVAPPVAAAFTGGRLLVVVLGGVTYSELRSAYEVSDAAHKEILIGGTSLLTPHAYIANLAAGSSGPPPAVSDHPEK